MTDLHTLELFGKALQMFVEDGTEKSMVQVRRYRKSTIVLSIFTGMILTLEGVKLAQGAWTEDPVAIAEPVVEPPIVPVPTIPVVAPNVDIIEDRLDALARLQVEQQNYFNLVLVAVASRKKPPEKPPELRTAETAVLTAIRK